MNKLLVTWDTFLLQILRLLRFNFKNLRVQSQFRARLSIKEQIIFLKRLSMMLRAQLPIINCLHMMTNEQSNKRLQVIALGLAQAISQGQSLSQALTLYKNTFGIFCIRIVSVAEKSGTLPENLEYIAGELKKKHELRTQIIGALIYPAIVVLATIAITAFLIVYIFPKIVPIFLSMKSTLPLSTQFLILVSNFLATYGWYVIIGVIIGVVITPLLLQNNAIAHGVTSLVIHLPIVGKICRYFNLAQISRTMSLLLVNDVAILIALDITSASTHNSVYRKALQSMHLAISSGKSFSSELKKYPFLFPSLTIQMVQAGESTGNLPTTLSYVSEVYEADIRDLTKNLTTIVEPVLMLFMGIIVGFIAISIITPIYGITQNIHQ